MTRQDFLKEIEPFARELGKEYKILPSLIMGVAAHESNFGDSELARQGKNIFSIKGEYNGQFVTLPTWEVYSGKRVEINAKFRKYPTFKESLRDFCELMKNGVSWNRGLYHSVIGVTDWKEVIELFAKTPYMTDPDYFKKLYNITESYALYAYNEEEPTPAPTAPDEATAEPVQVDEEPQPVRVDETATAAPVAPDEVAPDAAEPVQEEAEPKAQEPQAEEGQEATTFIAFPNRTFTIGSKGNYVEMIQEKIDHGLKVDGSYGPLTAAYVMVFQNENDLVSDGRVGEATWHVLFNH